MPILVSILAIFAAFIYAFKGNGSKKRHIAPDAHVHPCHARRIQARKMTFCAERRRI
ncbi:hypothetical protein [Pararhodobacter sp. CCB-MM2]|uniref:hypothetical protein n=1 Tax=Pararhodobacter sp. CCB-MM2 TaxID=1786003 RepID=UPI001314E88F|nr:hypothetical protein [Pararhodobacter sp. CCB-MM2]